MESRSSSLLCSSLVLYLLLLLLLLFVGPGAAERKQNNKYTKCTELQRHTATVKYRLTTRGLDNWAALFSSLRRCRVTFMVVSWPPVIGAVIQYGFHHSDEKKWNNNKTPKKKKQLTSKRFLDSHRDQQTIRLFKTVHAHSSHRMYSPSVRSALCNTPLLSHSLASSAP